MDPKDAQRNLAPADLDEKAKALAIRKSRRESIKNNKGIIEI